MFVPCINSVKALLLFHNESADYHDRATSSFEMLLTVCESTWYHRGLESYAMCTDTFYVQKTITFVTEYKIQPVDE
jgi:hypothetical protein